MPRGVSGRLALARWLTERPGAGPDGAGDGQPDLAASLRQADRADAVGLRPPRHAADPSRAARMAGRRVRRLGLVDQGDAPADHALEDLSARLRADSANAAIDTGNAWYWRFDRRPLDAEALRDSLLDLAGNLDRSTAPARTRSRRRRSGRFTAHHQFKAVYPSDHRSVYLMVQRLQPHPYLVALQRPRHEPVDRRARQLDHAAPVALPAQQPVRPRPGRGGSPGRSARATSSTRPTGSAWPICRPSAGRRRRPSGRRASAFLTRYEQSLADEGVPADRREVEAWAALARTLLASNEFLYVD